VSLLVSGASLNLRDVAVMLSGGEPWSPLTIAAYVFLLACLNEAIALPLAVYRGFLLERRYGLSREPLRTWVMDHVKAAALATVLGVGGAEVVYRAIRVSPRGWWVASALVFAGGVLLLTRVTPTLLLPMFYRFTPLERESLRARLLELSERAGVPVLGVYEWEIGAKTRRANAALVGAGATRRILVSDTLLAEYTDDEIEVILAHELAHHVHRDIPKALAVQCGLLLVGFAVAALALERTWQPFGLAARGDVAGLPVLLLAGGAATLLATPAVNAWSRFNERRADRYALDLTGRGNAFVSAMRRLGTQNLVEEQPSRLSLWLFHTHPPIEERIAAARHTIPDP
jgi:STE24 endopeptidase